MAGAVRIFAPSTERLLDQVAWFNRLRLAAAVVMLVLTGVAAHGFGAVRDPVPLYLLAALTVAVNALYGWWFPRLAKVEASAVRRHVDLQIAIDLLILTAILHFSGGVTNPCVLFYPFHAFIAALLLSVRAALVVVGASVLLAAVLAFGESSGWLAHHPLPGLWSLREATQVALAVWLAAFCAAQVLGVYFVGRVLSRLVRREQQLASLDSQLAQSEKLASVGTLAAGVAHEINNPVGVIQNKVQILRYRIEDGEQAPALLRELDVVERHAQRIGTITAGLLTFSRETPFALEPLDLNRLVREGADLVAVPFRNAGVALELALAEPSPRVRGSANHLLQVLVNLMLNAVDASPSGAAVTVRTESDRAGARLSVADRGHGIPADIRSKIFDPFFTTKDVGRGTGLGLAIAHGIVDQHQGSIEVESVVGQGTTFRIWLPVS